MHTLCKYLLLITLLGIAALSAWGAVATRDGDVITMQNDVIRLTIDLKNGARVNSYIYKSFGENMIYPLESCGGLLMDHVWEQTWPGEFLYRKYDAEIVNAGPADAVVRVWSMGTETTTKGIRFERLITLKEGDRALYCTVSLLNTTQQGKVTGYWNQNAFWFGNKENLIWARPMNRGVDLIANDAQGNLLMMYDWFYSELTRGWNGTYSKDRRQGMMALMDYNDLWRVYDNTSSMTTEWMYDKVAIPAGKSWTTDITLIPVAGMTGFKHGSKELMANFEVTPAPGGLTIEHQLARSLLDLTDVTVSTKVWGLKKQWIATVPDVKFSVLTTAVQSATVKAVGVDAMPAGIEVTVTGKATDGTPVKVVYGDYYGGAEGKNNDPFSMKAYLSYDRPPKKKVYLKPDVIQYTANPEPNVLYLRGLWSETFGMDQNIKAAFPKATIKDGWLDSSPVGLALTYFPAEYPDLMSYDLIILGNVPAAPMDMVGQEMLKDYLAAGGNLLILGGDQSYGQAGFTNQELMNLLPIELGTTYNWRKLEGDRALKAITNTPVTTNVIFAPKDVVFYSHLCTPKPGAIVAVKANDKPILVLGTNPKGGRVACVLATPFGKEEPGETAFWNAPAWKTLMLNTVRWLVKH